jgi:hypothetical protein
VALVAFCCCCATIVVALAFDGEVDGVEDNLAIKYF